MELLVAVGIVAVLVGIVFKAVPLPEGPCRGSSVCDATCARSRYPWPPIVQDTTAIGRRNRSESWDSDELDAYEDRWLAELEPYGATLRKFGRKSNRWKAPQLVSKSKDGRPKVHYTPTMFDENPHTPYKWSTQPWLTEIVSATCTAAGR